MNHRIQTHDCMTEDRTEMWAPRWGHSGGETRRAKEQCSASSTCVVPWLLVASSEQIPRLALCVDCVKGTPLYERVRGRRFRVRGGALSCAVGRGIVVTSYELRSPTSPWSVFRRQTNVSGWLHSRKIWGLYLFSVRRKTWIHVFGNRRAPRAPVSPERAPGRPYTCICTLYQPYSLTHPCKLVRDALFDPSASTGDPSHWTPSTLKRYAPRLQLRKASL
jgi:hypothetical protein